MAHERHIRGELLGGQRAALRPSGVLGATRTPTRIRNPASDEGGGPYATPMTCPSCGAVAPRRRGSARPVGTASLAVGDERRVVTVLFADIVGFTTLAETLDPEQRQEPGRRLLRAAGRRHRRPSAGRSTRSSATRSSPCSAPRSPTRTTPSGRCGPRCACRRRSLEHAAELPLDRCEMRIGVNTGEVLVGALRAGGDYTAMGDVVNTASRLQTSAQPGRGARRAGHPRGHPPASSRYEPLGLLAGQGPGGAGRGVGRASSRSLPPGYRPRRPRAPLVGRDTELGAARAHAVDSAVDARPGPAGAAGRRRRRGQDAAGRRAAPTGRRASTSAVCSRAGACPTARPTCGGRSPRRCARPATSTPTIPPTRPRERCLDRGRCGARRRRRRARSPGSPTACSTSSATRAALPGVDPSSAREEAALGRRVVPRGIRRVRPVRVVVLSDLHWADDAGARAHRRLLERLGPPPFVARRHRPPAGSTSAGSPTRAATTRSCSTSTRSTATAARELLDVARRPGPPPTHARRAPRPQRRQPVLPRGAGVAACAIRLTRPMRCPICRTTSAASSPLASTR